VGCPFSRKIAEMLVLDSTKRFPKNAKINNQNTFQFDDLAEFILTHGAALVRVIVLESHRYLLEEHF
jgi:hypothetical protein